MSASQVLSVRDLVIGTRSRTLVGPLSFDVNPGERVGLIGESGSGKSLTTLAVMGLLPDNLKVSGQIVLAGRSILGLDERAMAPLRGQVASMIFQEPMTAIDPTMRVGKQIAEVLALHRNVYLPSGLDSATSRRMTKSPLVNSNGDFFCD
jgi:ABC-type glutathione transport system ATPase component